MKPVAVLHRHSAPQNHKTLKLGCLAKHYTARLQIFHRRRRKSFVPPKIGKKTVLESLRKVPNSTPRCCGRSSPWLWQCPMMCHGWLSLSHRTFSIVFGPSAECPTGRQPAKSYSSSLLPVQTLRSTFQLSTRQARVRRAPMEAD